MAWWSWGARPASGSRPSVLGWLVFPSVLYVSATSSIFPFPESLLSATLPAPNLGTLGCLGSSSASLKTWLPLRPLIQASPGLWVQEASVYFQPQSFSQQQHMSLPSSQMLSSPSTSWRTSLFLFIPSSCFGCGAADDLTTLCSFPPAPFSSFRVSLFT